MKEKIFCILLIILFVGTFMIPNTMDMSNNTMSKVSDNLSDTQVKFQNRETPAMGQIQRTIRVAVYNETNATTPSYTTGIMNTNYSIITALLTSAGYDVTILTFQDILDHKLKTADFDVLVLADNVPRENITDLVKEFWLGGGGILSFDSGAGYLGYAGILPRESAGVDDGYPTYWDYVVTGGGNISERHPVTKDYALGESLVDAVYNDYAHYTWTALMNTSIASSLTKIAIDRDKAHWVKGVAMDPTDMGGKVVQLGIPVDPWKAAWENAIIDAVEWLAPRPKGRILFDLSHLPYYGVDEWDISYASTNSFSELRNALVNRTYTFDKLWPSASGNLTSTNLQGYDMLIIELPRLNFTAAEVSAVTDWVNSGGSLLVLGENTFFTDEITYINFLLDSYALEWNSTDNAAGTPNVFAEHPISENLVAITTASPGVVNVPSPAYPIMTTDSGDIIAGAQEYGNGRVVLVSDINIFDGARIGSTNNLQFAVNIANWLVSGGADVLLFVDEPFSPNYYRTPVALALSELDIDYYLMATHKFFNLSLNMRSWDMVVFDSPWVSISSAYLEEIAQHVEAGGKLIMSNYQVDLSPTSRLWPLLGFNFSYDVPNFSAVHIWEPSHSIFNIPNAYGASNLTPFLDYGDEGDVLNVFANATALAGITSTARDNESIIVLRNDGQTLYNGYLIDQFSGDLDDSTYDDNFELWMNQIAFIFITPPTIDNPSDKTIEVKASGESITWTPVSKWPSTYKVTRDGTEIVNTAWDGSPVTVALNEDDIGTVTYTLTVYDMIGASVSDSVVVTVEDTTAPTLVEAPANLEYEEGLSSFEVNWTFSDLLPDSYWFIVDNVTVEQGTWNGSVIVVDVGGFDAGTYNLTMAVNDTSGNWVSSVVTLTVTASSTTGTDTDTDTSTGTDTDTSTQPPSLPEWLILVIAVGTVIVLVVLVIMIRKSK